MKRHMNELPIIPPKPKTRLRAVLVGLGVIIFFGVSFTLGGLTGWWLHKSKDAAAPPDGNRSHPAAQTVEVEVDAYPGGSCAHRM